MAQHRAGQQRKADESERAWRGKIAQKCAAIPGVGFDDALRQVLTNRDERSRYYAGARAFRSSGASYSGSNGY